MKTILRKLYAKIEEKNTKQILRNKLLNLFKLKKIFKKIQNNSRDIHPRNIPTEFEKKSQRRLLSYMCRRTDGPTDDVQQQ